MMTRKSLQNMLHISLLQKITWGEILQKMRCMAMIEPHDYMSAMAPIPSSIIHFRYLIYRKAALKCCKDSR